MEVTRRELLVLTVIAAGGCANEPQSSPVAPALRVTVDAGPIARYSTPRIYSDFRDSHGFFIIHADGRIFAQSAMCTHRHCKIDPVRAGFECPCHGATFSSTGAVTGGPAPRPLPRLQIEQSPQGHLIIRADKPLIPHDQADAPNSFIAFP